MGLGMLIPGATALAKAGSLLTGAGVIAGAPGVIDWVGDQQSIEDTVDRDNVRYKPGKGIERNTMQTIGDFVFQRDVDAIEEEAKKRRRDALADTPYGQLLDDAGREYTADTTDQELRKKGRDLKSKEAYVNRYIQAGGTKTKDELYALDTATLGSMANTAERTKTNTDYTESQAYKDSQDRIAIQDKRHTDAILRADQLRADDRKEAREMRRDERLDRIDSRMSDREVRMLELGMNERMFDKRIAAEARASKKERMAAIIAGLTNLGGAFAI